MVATVAAGTTAKYYLKQVEYYLGGREPEGRWILAGSKLGVAAGTVVERKAFERLHAALDETGRSLIANDGGRIEQVGGYDFTFSAPKSIAVRWALAPDPFRQQLEAVTANAVSTAMEFVDRNAAYCRRGKGGAILEKVRLTAAAFQHGEARPAPHEDGTVFADPALHHHVVILNIAERADGTFGRLDGRTFFQLKVAAGAVYHQALAAGLIRLGLSVEITGTNGIFEVSGVDPALCQYFSARRHEIQDELAAIGLESSDAPALAAATARATRRSKAPDGVENRHAFWRERALALGFENGRLIDEAGVVGRVEELAADTATDVHRSSRNVLAQLTEKASVFEYRKLVAAIAADRVGSDTIVSIETKLDQLRADGAILALGADRWGHPIFSTPEVMQLERDIFVRAAHLSRAHVAAPAPVQVEQRLASAGLNAEQATAARLACGSQAIVTIEGAPGVGKTTLLAPVAAAWTEAGWRVIGASTAWKIANQLRDELGIEAKAIDSWLTGAEHDRPFLLDKTLLVLDESGLVTSWQMDRILREVERATAAGLQVAVRMVGDRRQLQPIGGPGLRIVADAIGSQRVDAIVRQREAWARDVVIAFGDGRAGEALESLRHHDRLHECAGPAAAVKTLVEAWDHWRREHPGASSLLIAKTNTQVAALNRAVRKQLRAAGELAPLDLASVDAVTPSGQSHKLDLAEADAVRFLVRNDELGVFNGTEGRLERIERAADDTLRFRVKVGGRAVVFAPGDIADENGRVRLAHAYATTCYGSQGLTTDGAFVLADAAMDRHDIHVAASRAREETHLFVDRRALDSRIKAQRILNDRKRDIEPQERLEILAAALGRSGVKQTTLDYLTPTQKQELVDRTGDITLDQQRQRAVDRQLDGAEIRSQQETRRGPSRRPGRSKGLSLD